MDPSVLRVRAPKVAQREPETYSAEQLDLVLQAAAAGWARLAILILLRTGMRVSELCALIVEDVHPSSRRDCGAESGPSRSLTPLWSCLG